MKTVAVAIADISVMQPMLDEKFGTDVFIIDRTINEQLNWKDYFLTYDDTVPQSTVDEAVQFVYDYNQTVVNNKRIRWYTKMQGTIQQKIDSCSTYKLTQREISDAQQWLNNQQDPVPGCVAFLAAKQSITNQQAAEYILNSETNYQNLVNQLNNILFDFQNNIMSIEHRLINSYAAETLAQINNIAEQ